MSLTAVTNGLRCCVCAAISLLLAATVVVGSSAAGASAMGPDSVSRLRLDVAAQDCQPAMIASPYAASCDASDDLPAQQPGCPMLGICVNIGAGVGHCGLVAVTDGPDFQQGGSTAVAIVFLQSAVRANGLAGESVFHPPIL